MRDDQARLLDIIESIDRIGKYSDRGRTAFEEDELVQTWIVYHLQIIGEACRALSEQLKKKNDAVPWRKISGMRNILIHQYFGIDEDAVWEVVENDLPPLRIEIERMLKDN